MPIFLPLEAHVVDMDWEEMKRLNPVPLIHSIKRNFVEIDEYQLDSTRANRKRYLNYHIGNRPKFDYFLELSLAMKRLKDPLRLNERH